MKAQMKKTKDVIEAQYEARRRQLSKLGFADGVSIKKVLRDKEHMRSKSLGDL